MRYLVTFLLIVCAISGKAQTTETFNKNKPNTEISVELLFTGVDKSSLTLWAPYEYSDRIKMVPITLENGKFMARFDIDKPVLVSYGFGNRALRPFSSGFNGNFLIIEPGEKLGIVIPEEDSKLFAEVEIHGEISTPKSNLMKAVNQMMAVETGVANDHVRGDFERYKKLDSILNIYAGVVSDSALNLVRFRNLAVFNRNVINNTQLLDSSPKQYQEQLRKLDALFPVEKLVDKGKFWIPAADQNVFIERAAVSHAINNNLDVKNTTPTKLGVEKMTDIIKDYYRDPIIVNELCGAFLIDRLKASGFSRDLAQIAQTFINQTEGQSYALNNLQKLITDSEQNLSAGSKAFAFNLLDEQKRNVTLADFRGKVVLLDFMYNGCPGCKTMVPSLEEIETHFSGRDIKFVSISIDNDFNRFLAAGGVFSTKTSVHLYTNGLGQNHDIIRHYQIQSYPTLVLIDKSGNLVSARAPDPRDVITKQKLIDLIDKAL